MILDFGCLLEAVKEPATTRTGPIEPCEASLSACEGYDSLRLTTRGSSRDDWTKDDSRRFRRVFSVHSTAIEDHGSFHRGY